jgi:hypothetical protein
VPQSSKFCGVQPNINHIYQQQDDATNMDIARAVAGHSLLRQREENKNPRVQSLLPQRPAIMTEQQFSLLPQSGSQVHATPRNSLLPKRENSDMGSQRKVLSLLPPRNAGVQCLLEPQELPSTPRRLSLLPPSPQEPCEPRTPPQQTIRPNPFQLFTPEHLAQRAASTTSTPTDSKEIVHIVSDKEEDDSESVNDILMGRTPKTPNDAGQMEEMVQAQPSFFRGGCKMRVGAENYLLTQRPPKPKFLFNTDEELVNFDDELILTYKSCGDPGTKEGTECAVCNQSDDYDDHPFVQWIMCDECGMWYHLTCLNLHRIPKNKWLCPACTMTAKLLADDAKVATNSDKRYERPAGCSSPAKRVRNAAHSPAFLYDLTQIHRMVFEIMLAMLQYHRLRTSHFLIPHSHSNAFTDQNNSKAHLDAFRKCPFHQPHWGGKRSEAEP